MYREQNLFSFVTFVRNAGHSRACSEELSLPRGVHSQVAMYYSLFSLLLEFPQCINNFVYVKLFMIFKQ